MYSIRFKITAISIAAILVIIACVLGVAYSTMHEDYERNSVEMMNLIGKDTENSLEKYTESIEQSVEMIANFASDTLDRVVLAESGVIGNDANKTPRTKEQKEQLDNYLSSYLGKVQEMQASLAAHTHGVITYYYCVNPELSEKEHGFFYSRVGKTGFEEREPLDARNLDPGDIAHNTWYYTPIKRGRPSWVGPYTAHFLGEMWVLSYLVPIYRSGTLIGVLGMDIPVETLTDQVRPIKVYKTGFVSLLDQENNVIYHPNMEFGRKLEFRDLSVDKKIFLEECSGDAQILYTSGEERRQLSFCTMSNSMKLFVSAPVSEVNAAWNGMVRNILMATLLIIIVFVVLMMLIMRFITRPLKELTVASQRLADADYDVKLEYHGKDELGSLTAAFTKMRDQQKKYVDDLNRQAFTDSLTELPNMRGFFNLALNERQRLLDEGRKPCLVYFDLIGMKYYNRQYGFSEGDKLLRDVAQILLVRFGEECICRYGDDHFAVVTDETHLEEDLQAVFRDCEKANNGNSLPIRAGVYPNSMEEVGVSIACDRAKFACDKRRESYMSGYDVFDEEMLKELEDVRYIINHLDQALENRWIKVFYQPIVDAKSGEPCDEEALSRWIDPNRGLLSPADFIPVLEKARLIYKLDLYVLDRILEKLQDQKNSEGSKVLPCSLNLSRADFDSCDIVEEICRRVDAAGLEHDCLTIEVTESMVGSDFDFMKEQICRFQKAGFKVWMDDFGSGYSSLDVLQDIHFDLLKFDMRFLQRVSEGDEGKIILSELAQMAIDLKIETVCEGVETEEQADFLREIGCTKLQGYYFGKPQPYGE